MTCGNCNATLRNSSLSVGGRISALSDNTFIPTLGVDHTLALSMQHDCPHCGESLKWKLVRSKPLPGERRFLPNHAIPVCPNCGGELAPNAHWSEQVVGAVIGIPLLGFLSARATITPTLAVVVGFGVFALWGSIFAFFHFRYWRHWQRYKAYVPPQR
jgi:predicted RNA-binding Zn-ribbon protein involved in translation (DUF1610 family)